MLVLCGTMATRRLLKSVREVWMYPSFVSLSIHAWLAEKKISASAPARICCASVEDAAKEKRTV